MVVPHPSSPAATGAIQHTHPKKILSIEHTPIRFERWRAETVTDPGARCRRDAVPFRNVCDEERVGASGAEQAKVGILDGRWPKLGIPFEQVNGLSDEVFRHRQRKAMELFRSPLPNRTLLFDREDASENENDGVQRKNAKGRGIFAGLESRRLRTPLADRSNWNQDVDRSPRNPVASTTKEPIRDSEKSGKREEKYERRSSRSEERSTVLRLQDGAPTPMLDFGRVNVGTIREIEIMVETEEGQDLHDEILFHGFSGATGFRLPGGKLYFLQPGTKSGIKIAWKPQVAGFTRCNLRLLWNQSKIVIVQIRGLASVDAAAPKLGKRGTDSLENSDGSSSTKKTKTSHKADAARREKNSHDALIGSSLRKSRTSSLGRATISASGFRVDLGGSSGSQELAFASWVNHVLVPFTSGEDSEGESGTCIENLHLERALLRCKEHLWQMYQRNETFQQVKQKLKKKVDEGILQIDPYNSLLNDVRIRDRALQTLLGYHPFWLKLALEVLTGVNIAGALPRKEDFKHLLETNILASPELTMEFQIDPAVNGVFRKGYKAASRRAVFCKCTLLVFLLDKALQVAPAGSPLLFRKSAKVKDSAGVLEALLKDSVQGGGNILRSLSLLGIHFSYKQPLNLEYNFRVANLALDLRDGIKLLRLVEVLANKEGLVKKAKLPVRNRLSMVFNVELALSSMAESHLWPTEGLTGRPMQACDIVCGDRERTLWLLWQMVVHWQISAVVDAGILYHEICLVRSQKVTNKCISCNPSDIQLPPSIASVPELRLLAEWLQAICARYGIRLTNISSDLADGTVFCLALHHYLGEDTIPMDSIHFAHDSASDGGHVGGPTAKGNAMQERMQNNYQLFERTMRYFGGSLYSSIPSGLSSSAGDENAMVAFLCFLFQRVVSSSAEVKAALCIQRSFRGSKRKLPPSAHLQSWINAASIIQRSFRSYLVRKQLHSCIFRQFRSACICIQSATRGWLVRKALWEDIREEMLSSAQWDTFVAYEMLEGVCLPLESYASLTRISQLRSRFQAFLHLVKNATIIQSYARAFLAKRRVSGLCRERNREVHETALAIRLQTIVRRKLAREHFLRCKSSAVRIQAYTRGFLVRRDMQQYREAALKIQSFLRGHKARLNYLQMRKAAVTIQSAYRGHGVRMSFLILHETATTIQAHWRGYSTRKRFHEMEVAAVVVQRFYRGHAARQTYEQLLEMKLAMEQMISAAEEYTKKYAAATKIQAAFRGLVARRQFKCMKEEWTKQRENRKQASAILIQSWWRGHSTRNSLPERFCSIRRSLRQANLELQKDPSCSIHAKARVALTMLLNSDCLTKATLDCASLDKATMYFSDCCRWMVESGAVGKLFQLIRSCDRSKPNKHVLTSSLRIVYNMCRVPELQQKIFDVDDSINILIEVLQIYRDMEHVFGLATQVLHIICTCAERVVEIRAMPEVTRRLQMIAKILGRKVEMEDKFLSRLTPSQRSSLPAFVAAEKRLAALAGMLEALLEVLDVLFGRLSVVSRDPKGRHSDMLRTLATPATAGASRTVRGR